MSDYPKFRDRPLHHKLSGLTFILLLILGGLTLWSAFVKPTQKQVIKVEKGGQAKIVTITDHKKIFIPFIEGGVEQRSNSDMGTYIRCGLRVEF